MERNTLTLLLGGSIVKFSTQSFVIGIAITFLSISAYADDVITIRYQDGMPRPDESSEQINLSVSRRSSQPAVAQTSKRDIDRLFEQVSAVLTENGIASDWQLAIPDAPSIKITIDINGQKLKLISCHVNLERSGKYLVTESGMKVVSDEDRDSVLAKQSETFRRRRVAFETILRLTLESARARFSP